MQDPPAPQTCLHQRLEEALRISEPVVTAHGAVVRWIPLVHRRGLSVLEEAAAGHVGSQSCFPCPEG